MLDICDRISVFNVCLTFTSIILVVVDDFGAMYIFLYDDDIGKS